MKNFFTSDRPMLTVMLQCATPELAIGRIRNARCLGAEAFGLQVESLLPEYQKPEVYSRIFQEMKDCPAYVTNYRKKNNSGKTDDELAEGLLLLAECGATLCDVPGDLFCPHPMQMTEDAQAIEKQMALIEAIHAKGAQVLMSAHTEAYLPAEQVLALAREQKRRGADVIKIVTKSRTMEEQIEHLRIIDLLKRELDAPFLYLCGGQCTLVRRLGIKLGCCMALCVYEHDAFSTAAQPLLSTMKILRDTIDF